MHSKTLSTQLQILCNICCACVWWAVFLVAGLQQFPKVSSEIKLAYESVIPAAFLPLQHKDSPGKLCCQQNLSFPVRKMSTKVADCEQPKHRYIYSWSWRKLRQNRVMMADVSVWDECVAVRGCGQQKAAREPIKCITVLQWSRLLGFTWNGFQLASISKLTFRHTKQIRHSRYYK